MERQQADAGKLRCSSHRSRHRVGDVEQFQIQEDLKTEARELSNSARAFGGEELAPDLDQAGNPAKLTRQGASRPQAVNIQGYD
jgi:hypothetical protein